VRLAKWPAVGQRAAFDLARHRRDHGNFQQFRGRQRRQNGGQPCRQHGFAGAGRADHEQIVRAGSSHFEGTLGAFLALDVLEIDERAIEFADFRLRARQHLRAAEMVGQLDQGGAGDDLHFRARPGRLRAAHSRTNEPLTAGIGADGRGKHPRHRRDGAIERKLAHDSEARGSVGRNGANRRHQPERNGEIVVTALLGQSPSKFVIDSAYVFPEKVPPAPPVGHDADSFCSLGSSRCIPLAANRSRSAACVYACAILISRHPNIAINSCAVAPLFAAIVALAFRRP